MNDLQRAFPDLPAPDAEPEQHEPVPGKESLIDVIQRKAAPVGAGAPPGSFDEASSLVGAGQPLHPGVQTQMQQSFGGEDFGGVRVHEGSGQASAIGAQAFAQGNDVHFAPGQYDPGSQGGRELIGHELTHVVQQREGRVATPQAKGAPINADTSLESEADTMGAAAARGEIVRSGPTGGSGSGAVQAKAIAIQKKDDPKGLANGNVTRHDFMGGHGPNPADTAKAQADAHTDDGMTLAQQGASIKTGTVRSEAEMLAACEAGHYPRFIARVSPTDDFTRYSAFGNAGRPFVFATEPANLRGVSAAHAMLKVGWEKSWILKSIGKDISVCIFDTTVAVPEPNTGAKKVEQGKMEWPELKATALADSKFRDAAEAKGIKPSGSPRPARHLQQDAGRRDPADARRDQAPAVRVHPRDPGHPLRGQQAVHRHGRDDAGRRPPGRPRGDDPPQRHRPQAHPR